MPRRIRKTSRHFCIEGNLYKQESIDNHQIIDAFCCVGMTGFEPATSRPPDDYYKSHYNLDYQCNAYLPYLLG